MARFFHGRDWRGDGKTGAGIALALGPDPEGVGNAVFLARAAALGQHRDHYSLLLDSDTMEPRVASPPFVEALRGLVTLKGFGPPGAEEFNAPAARDAFREGRAAMLIDRAERRPDLGGRRGEVDRGRPPAGLGPGVRPVEPEMGGRQGPRTGRATSRTAAAGSWRSPRRSGASGEAAIDFATYLINPETSNRVRSDRDVPMLPIRGSQIALGLLDPRSTPGVDSQSWADSISTTLTAPREVPALRIPRADAYLADLTKGRVAAVRGEPAEKALKRVSDAWAARTKSLGADRQLWHYRRSLNNLVTSPRPPAR